VEEESNALPDFSAQLEALRAMLRAALERRISPDEHAAMVELAEALVALLGENRRR
jgi:hypothetical protein